MLRDLISMVVYNLSQRRLRTFLTVLGIIIGVTAIVGIVSLGESMREGVHRELTRIGGDIITVIPGRTGPWREVPSPEVTKLTSSDLREISKIDGVEQVYAMITTNAKVEYGNKEMVLSINGVENPEAWGEAEAKRIGLENGKIISEEDKYSAVIGYSVSHEFFSKDVKLRKIIKINGVEFRVVGILNKVGGLLAASDHSIYIPIKTARDLFSDRFSGDEFSAISAKVVEGYDVDVVAEKVNKKLLKLHRQTEDTKTFTVMSPKFFRETIEGAMSTVTIFLGGIAAISLIVGGIGIANIMYVSVMERTRGIGVMKAIGATNGTILSLFLLESSMIGLIGGIVGNILGVILSYGLGFGIAGGLIGGELSIVIKPEILLLGCLFGFVVGILAGYFPARRAAKLEPAEALRYE